MSFWTYVVGGAAAYAGYKIFIKPKRPSTLRVAALEVSLKEDTRWGDRAPDTAQVDAYLIGVIPHGKDLARANTDTNRINFCAAAVGWAEHQTGFGNLPPWRSGAKSIMNDCISGARGNSRWHRASELRSGWRPPIGSLAVYHRGDPAAFLGHVDRVVGIGVDGYQAVGANEGGRKWNVDLTKYSTPALLGFVVDGEAPSGTAVMGQGVPPLDYVEPPLTPEERAFIRGHTADPPPPPSFPSPPVSDPSSRSGLWVKPSQFICIQPFVWIYEEKWEWRNGQWVSVESLGPNLVTDICESPWRCAHEVQSTYFYRGLWIWYPVIGPWRLWCEDTNV